ncbi:MAG: RsbRD N-terminal domain-containing protein [Fibrobacteria bacterium]|nr:RsbRD N-terminal domain-containing protein [Fibrobacteria bacterium]
MTLNELLSKNKSSILKTWNNQIISSYHPDTAKFLSGTKNQFANPVGYTTSESVEAVFNCLLNNGDEDDFIKALEPVMKIRTVQNPKVSKGIGFIFELKGIIRSALKKDLSKADFLNDWIKFEQKIDFVGLIAADVYLKCKTELFSIKAERERKMVEIAFRQAGIVAKTEKRKSSPDMH